MYGSAESWWWNHVDVNVHLELERGAVCARALRCSGRATMPTCRLRGGMAMIGSSRTRSVEDAVVPLVRGSLSGRLVLRQRVLVVRGARV